MFEINPGLIIWTVVTFVCLALVLRKFAWGPMLKALSAREHGIRDALQQAEKARADAAELIRENQRRMTSAEEEYQKMMREGKAQAEKLKEEILAGARREGQQAVDRARDEIQREFEAAKKELRSEVANLAIKAAEKLLEENLDTAKQKKIVDQFIGRLPAS